MEAIYIIQYRVIETGVIAVLFDEYLMRRRDWELKLVVLPNLSHHPLFFQCGDKVYIFLRENLFFLSGGGGGVLTSICLDVVKKRIL